MTFDLERARGLRDFLQDDCAEVGDVWAEMIAEIERMRDFHDRVARILKQPTTYCDDLLILGLDARLCQLKRQAARIKELEGKIDNGDHINDTIKLIGADAEAKKCQ